MADQATTCPLCRSDSEGRALCTRCFSLIHHQPAGRVDMTEDEFTELLQRTRDQATIISGSPVPAATTLLYRVCGNSPERFEEALRLVRLFVEEALRSSR